MNQDNFSSLGELLSSWLGKQRKPESFEYENELKLLWEEVLLEVISNLPKGKVFFSSFSEKKQEILVSVTSSVLLCDFHLNRISLLNGINQKLRNKDMKEIKNIKFKLA